MHRVWKAAVYNYQKGCWETVGRATSSVRARLFVDAAMREDVPSDHWHLARWLHGTQVHYQDFSWGEPDYRHYFYATVELVNVLSNVPFIPDRVVSLEVSSAASS